MSFSVARSKPSTHKRLARGGRQQKNKESPVSPKVEINTDLYILPYTERSFVVMGDTLNHSNALVTLGGKYNTNLKIGQGWIFAKVREPSVRKYIETGEVEPYVYSKEDQARFEKRTNEAASPKPGVSEQQLRKLFREFREAFDADEDYEGSSIIDVIYQLEEKHLPRQTDVIKASSKKKTPDKKDSTPTKTNHKRLASRRNRQPTPEPEPVDEDTEEEMEDESEEEGFDDNVDESADESADNSDNEVDYVDDVDYYEDD